MDHRESSEQRRETSCPDPRTNFECMRPTGLARVCAVALMTATLCAPRGAAAQTLSGTVTTVDGARAAGPSVLVVLDEQQTERARVVVNAGSRFVVPLPAGRYQLRVLRVGFAPFDAGAITLPEAGTSVSIRWQGLPVALPEVITRERQACDLTRTQGATLALIWGQISTVLGVTNDVPGRPREFERYAFVRRLDAEGRVVRGITQQRTRGTSITSYRAWDPDSLALHGYLREDEAGSTFFAPTATTLLSPSFLRSHCFELVDRPDGNRDRLAVRFEPASPRERVVDIAGSFWVDRRTARLDSVQFRYVGLPSFVSAEQARGSVHFMQLSDGTWFISQWTLRMPRIGERERRSSDNLRRTTFALEERAVIGVQEEGGVVLAAEVPGAAPWRAMLPMLRMQFDRRAEWFSVARVVVKGTDINAPIDSTGRSTIPVPQGRYDVALRFPFGGAEPWPLASALPTRTDARIGAGDDRLRTPTGDQVLGHLCGAEPVRQHQAALWGVVTDSLGTPVAGVTVTAKWVGTIRLPTTRRGDRLSATNHEAQSVTDATGHFLLCGVPRAQFVVEAVAEAVSGDSSSPWDGVARPVLDDGSRFEAIGPIVVRPRLAGR